MNPHQAAAWTAATPATTAGVVDLARLAPSVHNTQPWRWIDRAGVLELWTDRSRALPGTDPAGRNLVISCGAALHHARVAAGALGTTALVERVPRPDEPDLLARVALAPGPPSLRAGSLAELIRERCTDRRRFTSWPVSQSRLDDLVATATRSGAGPVLVHPVPDPRGRRRLERLDARARQWQERDPALRAETTRWIDRGPSDGIPAAVLPDPPAAAGSTGRHPHRFDPASALESSDTALRSSDGVLVLATPGDTPRDWLAVGEALSALWLRATQIGLSVVPLSQVVEVAATRDEVQESLPDPRLLPQVLVRAGWQVIGRSTLPRTPRRPLHDVLRRAV